MKRSERLRELAERVRNGDRINWSAEMNAMSLEQAAADAEYAERISERTLERLSGVGDSGPETESPDGSESREHPVG